MYRYAFACKINKGKSGDFRNTLGKCWSEIVKFLDRNSLKNFSLWSIDEFIFGYYESENEKNLSQEEKDCINGILGKFESFITWISAPDKEMRLMYQDFGIVRESKELIRHRMFMTKLKEGCAEEYKKRHDGLIEQRGDKVDEGPDSNFSIWSDGTYIFGYDEIDTTMEKEETAEEHEGTVAWETRQLGIMDWITNDCDWLTGEIHSASRRIAWHA